MVAFAFLMTIVVFIVVMIWSETFKIIVIVVMIWSETLMPIVIATIWSSW
jgi:hypothetical protein